MNNSKVSLLFTDKDDFKIMERVFTGDELTSSESEAILYLAVLAGTKKLYSKIAHVNLLIASDEHEQEESEIFNSRKPVVECSLFLHDLVKKNDPIEKGITCGQHGKDHIG